ncbi:hypothetical protein Thivi_2578 [Thiocystis violascens DSM 198]|uniref:Uncharacterized protein n=1 Tax=Thiocystis violascens (strain ATCC 17096 / DSM 198 / 6111) TaxID=765911 RepID=I3YBZ4_THIV6|nr:hypothetical protein Thivi_2578 [Thiocystis violascens DSM 198]
MNGCNVSLGARFPLILRPFGKPVLSEAEGLRAQDERKSAKSFPEITLISTH